MCVAEWLVGEIQNLLIAVGRRSNPRSSFFLIALSRAAFCRALISANEADKKF